MTPTRSTSLFSSFSAAPADAEAGDTVSSPQSSDSDLPSDSSSALVPHSGVVVEAGAVASAGASRSVELDSAHWPLVAQRTTRVDEDHADVELETADRTDHASLAAAKAQAEFELTLGQILNMATGGRGPSNEWLLARMQAVLEPKAPPRRSAKG